MSKNKRKALRKYTRRLSNRYRLSVYRSNDHIYAQIIDDAQGKTLVSSNSLKLDVDTKKTETAKKVGLDLGEKAVKLKIKDIYFERKNYRFKGRVKQLCDSAREAGLNF